MIRRLCGTECNLGGATEQNVGQRTLDGIARKDCCGPTKNGILRVGIFLGCYPYCRVVPPKPSGPKSALKPKPRQGPAGLPRLTVKELMLGLATRYGPGRPEMASQADSLINHQNQSAHSFQPAEGVMARWIYVFTAVSFIGITLAGFIPDSLVKIAAVEAGKRAPFPPLLHLHALLMGSFLILLVAQTSLVATGRRDLHRRLGLAAFVLAPALVIVGFLLAPTMYHMAWHAAQSAPPEVRGELHQGLLGRENNVLTQLRIGVLFPVFLFIGLRARKTDPGLHKRMMLLATAAALPPAIDRITWLPTTFPNSPLGTDLYVLIAIAPLFIWDVWENRKVHRAYLIWLEGGLLTAVPVYAIWGSDWWRATVPRIMGI